MKEFSEIVVVIRRNPKWLEQHEKQGFFLSNEFELATFQVPVWIKSEKDLDKVKVSIKIENKELLREK